MLALDTLRNHDNPERFNSAEMSQPLCTALQIAILHHLRRSDTVPIAVVGHSSGEIAAAYAAGYISFQLAIKSAFFRGSISKNAQGDGGMAAIGLSSEQVSTFLIKGVVVACKNSPVSTTISGDRTLVEQVVSELRRDQPEVFVRLLKVNMAYHSRKCSSPTLCVSGAA
jgi:acyl transferase domain-containing protein